MDRDEPDADRATYANAVPTADHEIAPLAERIHAPAAPGSVSFLLPEDYEALHWDAEREV